MPPSRRARAPRPLVFVLAIALAGIAAPAGAQPSSRELRGHLDRAEERLDDIAHEVGAAVEEYNEAEMALDAATAAQEAAEAELEELTSEAEAAMAVVAVHARRLHKLGPTMELSSIFAAGDPTEAGNGLAVMRRVLNGQRADLEALEALEAALAATEERLADARAEADERAAEVAERREELESLLAVHEQEVEELRQEVADAERREEEERRRREEERLRREAQERREAEQRREAERRRQQEAARQRDAAAAAGSASAPSTPAPSTPAPSTPEPAPSTRKSAQVAVDTALAQLGKPYQWAGSGPNSFDCSGLTSFAWRAAGVSLPRSSGAQYNATTRISRSDLQPGDLVFYHSPISHVAMYIGGGRVVEAPYSGNVVRIRDDGLTRRGVVGYGRP